jgi:hypothetical protein
MLAGKIRPEALIIGFGTCAQVAVSGDTRYIGLRRKIFGWLKNTRFLQY